MSRKIRVSNNNKKNTRRLRGGVLELKPEDSEEFLGIQMDYLNSGIKLSQESQQMILTEGISSKYFDFIGDTVQMYTETIDSLSANSYDKVMKQRPVYEIPAYSYSDITNINAKNPQSSRDETLAKITSFNDGVLKPHLENQKKIYAFLSSKQKSGLLRKLFTSLSISREKKNKKDLLAFIREKGGGDITDAQLDILDGQINALTAEQSALVTHKLANTVGKFSYDMVVTTIKLSSDFFKLTNLTITLEERRQLNENVNCPGVVKPDAGVLDKYIKNPWQYWAEAEIAYAKRLYKGPRDVIEIYLNAIITNCNDDALKLIAKKAQHDREVKIANGIVAGVILSPLIVFGIGVAGVYKGVTGVASAFKLVDFSKFNITSVREAYQTMLDKYVYAAINKQIDELEKQIVIHKQTIGIVVQEDRDNILDKRRLLQRAKAEPAFNDEGYKEYAEKVEKATTDYTDATNGIGDQNIRDAFEKIVELELEIEDLKEAKKTFKTWETFNSWFKSKDISKLENDISAIKSKLSALQDDLAINQDVKLSIERNAKQSELLYKQNELMKIVKHNKGITKMNERLEKMKFHTDMNATLNAMRDKLNARSSDKKVEFINELKEIDPRITTYVDFEKKIYDEEGIQNNVLSSEKIIKKLKQKGMKTLKKRATVGEYKAPKLSLLTKPKSDTEIATITGKINDLYSKIKQPPIAVVTIGAERDEEDNGGVRGAETPVGEEARAQPGAGVEEVYGGGSVGGTKAEMLSQIKPNIAKFDTLVETIIDKENKPSEDDVKKLRIYKIDLENAVILSDDETKTEFSNRIELTDLLIQLYENNLLKEQVAKAETARAEKEAAKAETERAAKVEKEKVANEKAETERAAKVEKERVANEKAETERLEKERVANEKAAAAVNPVIAVIDEVIQTLPENTLKTRLGEYKKLLQDQNRLSDIDVYNTEFNEDGVIEQCFRKQLVKQIETYRDEYDEDEKAKFKIILEDYKEKEDKYIKSNQKLFSFEIILRNEPMVETEFAKQLIDYRKVYSTGADLINGDGSGTENRYQNINLYVNFIQSLRTIILNNGTINKELANAAEIILKDFETRSAKLLRSKMDVKDRFTKKIRYTTNDTAAISELIPKTQDVDSAAFKKSLLTDDSIQIAEQAVAVKVQIDKGIGSKSKELKELEEKYKNPTTDLTEKAGVLEEIKVREKEIKDLKKDRSNIEKIEKMKRIPGANTNNFTVKKLMPTNIFGKPKLVPETTVYIEPTIVDGDNGNLIGENVMPLINNVVRIHIEISKGGLKVIAKDQDDKTVKEYPITDVTGWNSARSELFGFGPVDEDKFVIPKYENGTIKFIMYLQRKKMTVQINNSDAKIINTMNGLKLFAPELDKALNARPAKSFFGRSV